MCMYFSIGNTSCWYKAVFESEVAIVNGFPTVRFSPIGYKVMYIYDMCVITCVCISV